MVVSGWCPRSDFLTLVWVTGETAHEIGDIVKVEAKQAVHSPATVIRTQDSCVFVKTERLKFSLSNWWDFRQAAQCILPYGKKLIKCCCLLDSVSALGEPAENIICPMIYQHHPISIKQKKNIFSWVRLAWIILKKYKKYKNVLNFILKIEKYSNYV